MLDAGRHPKINMLAYSEVQKVSGKAGNFTVDVLRKARFVKEDVCNACGDCLEKLRDLPDGHLPPVLTPSPHVPLHPRAAPARSARAQPRRLFTKSC